MPSTPAGTPAGTGAKVEVKDRNYNSNMDPSAAPALYGGPPSNCKPLLQPSIPVPAAAAAQLPVATATLTHADHDMLIYAPSSNSEPPRKEGHAPYARLKLHTITADQPQRTGLLEYRLMNYLTLLANETRSELPVIPPNPAVRVRDFFPPELFATRVHFYIRELGCIGPAISTTMRIAQSNRSLVRYTLQDWLVGQAGVDYPSYPVDPRNDGYAAVAELAMEQQRDVWDSPLRHLFYQVVVAHCAFQSARNQVRARARAMDVFVYNQAVYQFTFLADGLRNIDSADSACRW